MSAHSRQNLESDDEDDGDDLYSGYNIYPTDLGSNRPETASHQTSKTSRMTPRPGTPTYSIGAAIKRPHTRWVTTPIRPLTYRSGTSFGKTPSGTESSSAGGDGPSQRQLRPMSAVKGAGYTRGWTPMSPGSAGSPLIDISFENSPKTQIKRKQAEILELIDETILLQVKGDLDKALEMAKEVLERDKALLALEEDNGLDEGHNWMITFDALVSLGTLYETAEMYPEALEVFNSILKHPNIGPSYRIKAKIHLGNIHMKQGGAMKALKMYRKVMDQLTTNYEISDELLKRKLLHNMGIILVQKGFFEDAVSSFKYLMTDNPSFKAGSALLGANYLLGDPEEMAKAFRALLLTPIDYIDHDMNSGILSEHKAIQIESSDTLNNLQKDRKLYAERAVVTCARSIAPEIDGGFDWVIEAVQNSHFSYLAQSLETSKAMTLIRDLEPGESAQILKSFEIYEGRIEPETAINLSALFFLEGNLEKAETYAEMARELDYYDPHPWVCLGNVAHARGKFDEAKTAFLEALDRDSYFPEALYNLGLSHQALKEWDFALEKFRALIEVMPKNPEVLFQLGLTHQLRGDFEEAEECYKKVIEVDLGRSSDPCILKRLGHLAEMREDLQGAFQYFSEAHRADPTDLECLEWLAVFYKNRGNQEKAISMMVKGSLHEPHDARWPIEQAKAHISWGNYSEGLDTLEGIHRTFPENLESLQRLAGLTSDLSMAKEAEFYAMKLRELEDLRRDRGMMPSRRRDVEEEVLSCRGCQRHEDSSSSKSSVSQRGDDLDNWPTGRSSRNGAEDILESDFWDQDIPEL